MTGGLIHNALRYSGSGGGANLGTKTITDNGTYTAQTDGYDGYSSVTVDVPQQGGGIISLIENLPTLAEASIVGAYKFVIKHGNPLGQGSQSIDSSQYYDSTTGSNAYVAWIRYWYDFNYMWVCLYSGSSLIGAVPVECTKPKVSKTFFYTGNLPNISIYLSQLDTLTSISIDNINVRRSTVAGSPNCSLSFRATHNYHFISYRSSGTILREGDATQVQNISALAPFSTFSYQSWYMNGNAESFARACEAFWEAECGNVIEHI